MRKARILLLFHRGMLGRPRDQTTQIRIEMGNDAIVTTQRNQGIRRLSIPRSFLNCSSSRGFGERNESDMNRTHRLGEEVVAAARADHHAGDEHQHQQARRRVRHPRRLRAQLRLMRDIDHHRLHDTFDLHNQFRTR